MQHVVTKSKYFLTLLVVVSQLSLNAQNSCLEKAELATKEFNQGDFVTSLNSLIEIEKSDECKLSVSERENILTLIVRNLIELDWIEEIDLWDKKLYENNPYFKPKEDILEEDFMLYLSNHYAKPKIDISASIGTRFTYVERLKTYSIYEMLDYVGSRYYTEPQPSFGFSSGFYLSEQHKINFSLGFHRMSNTRIIEGFEKVYDNATNNFSYVDQPYPYYNNAEYLENFYTSYTSFDEEIKSASFGLDYNFILNFNDHIAFSTIIGYQMNYFYDVEHSILVNYYDFSNNEYLLGSESTLNSASWNELDRSYYRNDIVNYLNLGLEFLYRYKGFTFFINSSFQYGFENFVKEEARNWDDNINHTLFYKFYYSDEDYKLHFFTSKLGLKYNLKYNVK